jgi:hypothetical protein
MNGLDLYREIKKAYARVKTCFLTALIDLQEYEDFKKRSISRRPIDNEDLLKRVNEMITGND